MKKEILALLVVVACWGSTLQANDWKNAPISEVQKAAEQGLAEAQLVLGVMYFGGRGVAQDDKQAAAWTRKAAEQGYVDAQLLLGIMYEEGKGVAQDDKQAVAWFRKAAEQGDAHAQYNLGWMYDKGRGVAQD
ncbi:tetratricopeptide repeat protein, partial [Aeromonas veronii]|uniref:tetratricopeptide repeat protein n=2 Tax=Aeromonadaceae TaxID=84642 RepID=UPI003006DF07